MAFALCLICVAHSLSPTVCPPAAFHESLCTVHITLHPHILLLGLFFTFIVLAKVSLFAGYAHIDSSFPLANPRKHSKAFFSLSHCIFFSLFLPSGSGTFVVPVLGFCFH